LKPEEVPQKITINIPTNIIWELDKEAKLHNISREQTLEDLIKFIYWGKVTNNATSDKNSEGRPLESSGD